MAVGRRGLGGGPSRSGPGVGGGIRGGSRRPEGRGRAGWPSARGLRRLGSGAGRGGEGRGGPGVCGPGLVSYSGIWPWTVPLRNHPTFSLKERIPF